MRRLVNASRKIKPAQPRVRDNVKKWLEIYLNRKLTDKEAFDYMQAFRNGKKRKPSTRM